MTTQRLRGRFATVSTILLGMNTVMLFIALTVDDFSKLRLAAKLGILALALGVVLAIVSSGAARRALLIASVLLFAFWVLIGIRV